MLCDWHDSKMKNSGSATESTEENVQNQGITESNPTYEVIYKLMYYF